MANPIHPLQINKLFAIAKIGPASLALAIPIAVLQAYVFAILTCIYLDDALHPRH
jgi:F0F1-type ATP synthase membrane subunit a